MNPSSVSETRGVTPASRLEKLLPELLSPQEVSGSQFLRLQLTTEITAAIALDWIEESLLLENQAITPIPNLPAYVAGLMSSKGRVFWVIDFVQMLGLSAGAELSQHYEVVVLRVLATDAEGQDDTAADEERFLGLVVPKVRGTVRLTVEEIISPVVDVHPGFQPYLSGQAAVANQEMLVLSAEAIGRSQMTFQH